MYYICKFPGIWIIYDSSKETSKVLRPQQIETLKGAFPAALRESAVFDTLKVAPIPANKLEQLTISAYVICKFAGAWSIYDGYHKTSKVMVSQQAEDLKDLFEGAYKESAIFDALIVTSISASKLQALTISVPPPAEGKKPAGIEPKI